MPRPDPVFVEFLRGYMYSEAQADAAAGRRRSISTRTSRPCSSSSSTPTSVTRLLGSVRWSSDRIPKWNVPVVEHNLATGGLIRHSATLIASWARYAEGVDEHGQPIEIVDAADGGRCGPLRRARSRTRSRSCATGASSADSSTTNGSPPSTSERSRTSTRSAHWPRSHAVRDECPTSVLMPTAAGAV